jgi:hypothetical protein
MAISHFSDDADVGTQIAELCRTDLSILANWVFQPFWRWLVEFFPRWLAYVM